jgi:hypothetical protein
VSGRNQHKLADGLEAALNFAVSAHHGQRDKAGAAYMEHLLAVMQSVPEGESRQVALLHDVIEDTNATSDHLRAAGLSDSVIEAVELLTRSIDTTYADYVIRLKPNELARQVKMADLRDNYRIERVAFRADHAIEDARRIMGYILSFQFLADAIDESEYRRRMAEIERLVPTP